MFHNQPTYCSIWTCQMRTNTNLIVLYSSHYSCDLCMYNMWDCLNSLSVNSVRGLRCYVPRRYANIVRIKQIRVSSYFWTIFSEIYSALEFMAGTNRLQMGRRAGYYWNHVLYRCEMQNLTRVKEGRKFRRIDNERSRNENCTSWCTVELSTPAWEAQVTQS